MFFKRKKEGQFIKSALIEMYIIYLTRNPEASLEESLTYIYSCEESLIGEKSNLNINKKNKKQIMNELHDLYEILWVVFDFADHISGTSNFKKNECELKILEEWINNNCC